MYGTSLQWYPHWATQLVVQHFVWVYKKTQIVAVFSTQRASDVGGVSRVTSHPVAIAAAWRHACVFSRRTDISPLVGVRIMYFMLVCSGIVFVDVPPSVTTPEKVRAMNDKSWWWKDIYLALLRYHTLLQIGFTVITLGAVHVVYD